MDTIAAGLGPISQNFASGLRMTKKQWIDASPHGCINQSGGAYVGAELDIPTIVAGELAGEGQIETFLVDSDGRCRATGDDSALIEAFMPAATELASRVLASLADFDVAIESPAYLTVSVTPLVTVTTTPHFDDDQYLEDAGVGVVAIAANGGGPRVACVPLRHQALRPGLPLALDPAASEEFANGEMPSQQADANRIVVFPQFGQLHAGPGVGGASRPATRSLLVFRAATLPG